MSFLQVIWSVLIAVLLAVYLLLDGFDLGVGVRYLFEKKSEDRRTMLAAIGPVWRDREETKAYLEALAPKVGQLMEVLGMR